MDFETSQLLWSVGRWAAKGALSLAAVTFLIQWLLPRLSKWYRVHAPAAASGPGAPSSTTGAARAGDTDSNAAVLAERRKKQEAMRQDLQEKHRTKAESYKERIAGPREEARKQQKEEEFYKFMGPAWRGKGQAVGKDEGLNAVQDDLDQFEDELNPGQMAAVRRRIQKPTPQPYVPPQKPKRVITLPEEPEEGDKESVLVILRSPIQTVYQRRLRHSDTVQTLLDFMTVSGFSATFNTLCTSFPRQDVGKDKEVTMLQLGFTRRVTLNIEEKDL